MGTFGSPRARDLFSWPGVYWGSCVPSLFSVRPISGKFPAPALGQRSVYDGMVAQRWECLALHHSDGQHMLLAPVFVDPLKSIEFCVWVRLIYASVNVLLGEAACFLKQLKVERM